MPVGRIQYIFLFPFSFGEFLTALRETELRAYVNNFSNLANILESLHLKLSEYVRKYFFIGGMPAVVQEYITTRNIINCQKIQRSIVDCQVMMNAELFKGSQSRIIVPTLYREDYLLASRKLGLTDCQITDRLIYFSKCLLT